MPCSSAGPKLIEQWDRWDSYSAQLEVHTEFLTVSLADCKLAPSCYIILDQQAFPKYMKKLLIQIKYFLGEAN